MVASMRKLHIPAALVQEFATVEAIWKSGAKTRRVDALILSWVKYEKQLRRLFSFLVFQHPAITRDKIDDVISVLVKKRDLYPETFVVAIRALGVTSVAELLAPRYEELWKEIRRIKKYRNKLMHGQITGDNIKSPELERDVAILIDWIGSVADAADKKFGYDGLQRNTFIKAKSASRIVIGDYPFNTAAELKAWLSKLSETSH